MRPTEPADPVPRFWNKVAPPDERGCMIWTASKNPKGYGIFTLSRKVTVSAHRYAWMITNGEIGQWHVLHRCDNPSCVNPEHLFLGNHQTNAEDCAAKGRDSGKQRSLAKGRDVVKRRRDEAWEKAQTIAEPLWGKPSHEWPVHKIVAVLAEHGLKYSSKTLYNRLGTREDAQERARKKGA